MKAETTRVSPPRRGQSIAPIVGDEAGDDDVASESIQLPWISLVCIDQNESRKMSLADPWSTRKQSVGRDLQSCQKISAKACPGHKRDRNIFRQATYRSKSAVLTYPLLCRKRMKFLRYVTYVTKSRSKQWDGLRAGGQRTARSPADTSTGELARPNIGRKLTIPPRHVLRSTVAANIAYWCVTYY